MKVFCSILLTGVKPVLGPNCHGIIQFGLKTGLAPVLLLASGDILKRINLFRARSKSFNKLIKTIKDSIVYYPQLCHEDHKNRHIYFKNNNNNKTATTTIKTTTTETILKKMSDLLRICSYKSIKIVSYFSGIKGMH